METQEQLPVGRGDEVPRERFSGFTREVARRVFAREFKESNLIYKDGEDQYSPHYLLTPTGANCNRLLIVGTLTEKENIGTEAEYWRARVVDPTGAFFVYAGQYQPEAAQALIKANPPEFVAVIGKPSAFTTSDGATITSIRPETIQIVDAETRDRWVLETAKQTLKRIEALEAGDPSLTKVKEHYTPDTNYYREMIVQALNSLRTQV
jgi:RPA family protein